MNQKILVLGASRSKGKSKKTGKYYDVCKLHVATDASCFGEAGECFGLEGSELSISEKIFDKAKSFDFPVNAQLKITTDIKANRFRVLDIQLN
ncbi:hypothetical protein DXV75_14505 [Alteromonas aestuariivivens]|uniref:Uncharacterized protein n=1 Tax=Alteromonas aestuariivivens TaxID=1938339 RepID=A0A3D8M3V4_9ALTE|nr:hypothetical protein [Alteromonas aestuariivivens]RDV24423.1 hypothetical protein DXV75_14505 [Alteromonas aestuariivivens]